MRTMIDVSLQDVPTPMLLIEAPTGVRYVQQCGGVRCDLQSVEGYLVPISTELTRELWAELTKLWTDREYCDFRPNEAAHAVALVESVEAWVPTGKPLPDDIACERLAFDQSRANRAQEAWVPVIAGGRRAWLIWENSD